MSHQPRKLASHRKFLKSQQRRLRQKRRQKMPGNLRRKLKTNRPRKYGLAGPSKPSCFSGGCCYYWTMIGICLPSRGLTHSRTFESLWLAMSVFTQKYPKMPIQLYFTHNLPIPDCFNEPLKSALADGCSHAMILEEDVGLPQDGLLKLYRSKADITAFDYPLRGGSMMYGKRGKYWITGTGATMFTASALRQLLPFRTTVAYRADDLGVVGTLSAKTALQQYGMHDIDFSKRA